MSERRAQLLRAAERLFGQYGPHKTTVADIAQAASIGVGSVYLEFRNKNSILGALSDARHQAVLDATAKAWGSQGLPARRLELAIEARMDAFLRCARGSSHGAELLHCGRCDAIQRSQHRYREAERDLFTRMVTEGQQLGAFTTDDPSNTARALLLSYAAFSAPAVFDADEATLRRDLAFVHQLVLSGLLVR